MTLVASLLFLSALAASALAIAQTVRYALPRITEIIEAEFEPPVIRQRTVNFGIIRIQQKRSADVIALQQPVRILRSYQLAA